VLATLVWSGAGAALDPGSLPWWGRTPAYAAIVVAGSAAVRTPLALWSGLIRERRWGFSTQRLPSWAADRAKAVGVNIVLTAVALLGLVGFARALPGWWAAPAAAAFASLPPSGEERTPAPGFVRAFASCPRINCGLAI